MREYKTICCDIPADFDACLNELDAEGWMVDQRVVVPRAGYPELLYAFLSRPSDKVTHIGAFIQRLPILGPLKYSHDTNCVYWENCTPRDHEDLREIFGHLLEGKKP